MEKQIDQAEVKRRRLNGRIPRIGDTVKFLHSVDHGPRAPVRFERVISDVTVTLVHRDLQHVDIDVTREALRLAEEPGTLTVHFTRVRRDNDVEELDSWHFPSRFA